ncbi:Oidioi.mRNA.OKI2018_I69.chr1.g1920.t1.cds [Oikopleura dioica]|uniref:Oidioi.mRNA.OKI2018_I69.chr1.g1920.t1.cds n=1 Tax=Oikopleura dioica TaxID=34765 RepID=A0ABN7SUI4_OIKDI|nr:Oidioi.mRNA.OKI2018_I69.chr1.g1920.t1.cds [Oikopleura dioica]
MDLEVAIRFHPFDPNVFRFKNTERNLHFEPHYLKNFDQAVDKISKTKSGTLTQGGPTGYQIFTQYSSEKNALQREVVPYHPNIIRHFVNFEIFDSCDFESDCLGWITVMELCNSNLREKIKIPKNEPEYLGMSKRKRIAIGVKKGFEYLSSIGIWHCDVKPENVLLSSDESRIIDFGILCEQTGRVGYRKMGYTRHGSRYKDVNNLRAGSAGFCEMDQISSKNGFFNRSIFVFIFCDWQTAWYLLYNPLGSDEHREQVSKFLKQSNAEWLRSDEIPSIDNIQNEAFSQVIGWDDSLIPKHSLDSFQMSKAIDNSNLKERLTKTGLHS